MYEAYGASPDVEYMLTMSCIGMGDLNAVDVAEECHLECLRDAGALGEGLLQWGDPLPSDATLQGVYIDDGGIIGIIDTASAHKDGPDADLARRCVKACEDAGFDVAHHKGFGACQLRAKDSWAAFGELSFTLWGTEVRSVAGTVGGPGGKRLKICKIGLTLLRHRVVERKMLERFVALLIHPCTHRRLC